MIETNEEKFIKTHICQRSVTILSNERITLVSSSSDQGGSSGGWSSFSMNMCNPQVIRNVHDAVSYLRTFMTGDLCSLPECRSVKKVEMIQEKEIARSVSVRTARNGYIVEPGNNDGRGWIRAIGDEVIFYELEDMLKFCMDHLEGITGTNWWECSPWKESRES